ncbi:hypothetical protein CASFOL_017730 [Castilleja foliolosa]|uniref:Uncharacterized protein n=1 Tax=Castilleja foliolosa TaxID=1961234 RepID=A0ABD3DAV1_9LAMI
MAFVRFFSIVLVLIILNFSYSVKARPLIKNSILLSENDLTKLDPSYLKVEKIPPEVLCSLLGGCEKSMKTTKSINHLAVEDLQRKSESRAVDHSYLGDEKIPPELLCSLLGGCEQSMTTPTSTNHIATEYVPSKKELTAMEPKNLVDVKIPPEALCSLLGGCEQSIKTPKSTNNLMTKDSNGIRDSATVPVRQNRLGDEKIPPAVICSLIGGC